MSASAQPVLAAEIVRFVGEAIAAAVAATEAEAEDIADGVTVMISEMPAIIDGRAAMQDGAPLSTRKPRATSASKARWRHPALPRRMLAHIAASRSNCAHAGKTRHRSKPAPDTPRTIRFRNG